VVADEVRKLAEKTMAATKQVGEAIRDIQQGTRDTVDNVERAARAVDEATALATSSGEALREIVALAERTTDQVRSIESTSREQAQTSDRIGRGIGDVTRTASSVADSMLQSAQAVDRLADQARVLSEMIDAMQAQARGLPAGRG